MRNQVHEKMLNEMNTAKVNPVMERLHNHFCNVTDLKILKGIMKDDRSLLGASEYCYKKGMAFQMKFGNIGVADVTPEMEIDWAEEYFKLKKIEDGQLKKWPIPKGEIVYKDREVIKEVVKEVFVGTPSAEHIAEFIESQKVVKQPKVKVEVKEENLSLFD